MAIAAGAAVVLLACGLATPLPARAATAPAADLSPADAQWAASDAAAEAIAAAHDHAVGVTGESTPTTEVLALPDGQMQLVSDSVPQRVLSDGAWKPVNTKLTLAADGLWTPSTVPNGIEFSSGNTSTMARIQAPDGSWADQTWPDGILPVPSISGSTATYSSVLPGVDLVLSATPSGMSEIFEVHSETAAANPQLQALELGVQGATLSEDQVDSTVATFSSGAKVKAQEPLWWDSSQPGSSPAGPGGKAEPKPVAHSVTASHEDLDITAIGSDTSAVYPIFVDPAWSSGDNDHWYDDMAYPNQSYLNGNYNSSWLGTGSAVQDGISYRSRAFWQFPTGALAGKTISDARLTLNETESWSSTDTAGLYLIESPLLTPGATWNQENATANVWAHPQATFTPVAGTNGVGVAAAMQWAASNSIGSTQFGLRASDESNLSDRKHWALNATLAVTYDSAPNGPTGLSIASPVRGCGTAVAPAWVNSKAQAITLQASATDPDGGDLSVLFNVVGTAAWNGTASGAEGAQTAQIPKGALGDGSYSWHATANDGTLSGPASGTCYFSVDNEAPAWPTVTLDSGVTSLTIGKPSTVDVTVNSADHVAELVYWWTSSSTPGPTANVASVPYVPGNSQALAACPSYQGQYTIVCASAGTTALTVAPPYPQATLWVEAVDGAGNVSPSGSAITSGFLSLPTATLAVGADDGVNPTTGGGHEWVTDVGVSPTQSSVADTNQTALPVTLGSGQSLADATSTQADLPTDLAQAGYSIGAAFSFAGYSVLHRGNNGSDHMVFTEGALPSGYALESVNLGAIGSTDGAQPSGTHALYECKLSTGDEMTTGSSNCEGQSGYSLTTLGYIWAAPPAGIPSEAIYRCRVGAEHFTSPSSNCEGQIVESTLGYTAVLGQDQTSQQAIDTTKSFTAAAWVYPEQTTAASTHYHTILSESGATSSGFYLQESPGGSGSTGGSTRMCLHTQAGAGQMPCATAPGLPLGKWSLVIGEWDASNHQISVRVGDVVDPSAVAGYAVPSGDTSATGHVVIGGATSLGFTLDSWNGLIADPGVYQGILDHQQIENLYFLSPAE
ncbi:LamG domain-containing protein [Gryllotalpicola protaetiae]|nr:LamG domain-containing protein [Gryllotalpicola protaetiae]